LAGKTKKVATLEEINEAVAAGWAGEHYAGLTKRTEQVNFL